jgi:glycosyltransferase involved in cell wall biosynthesis
MRLSILIPTHNYDCSRLVYDLETQLSDDDEIIVGNDCSTDKSIVAKLNEIGNSGKSRLYTPSENQHPLGRAAIRNALAREAKGEWLLFIDADAEVRSKTFIDDYLAAANNAPVICGGTGNLPECPSPECRLRYDYEVEAEKRLTVERRQRFPYAQLTTFNFLIRRDIFLSIEFDEKIREYGYEDTCFGFELKEREITIHHIDNKLTHLGIETSDVYLSKIETALRSLAKLELEQCRQIRLSAFAMKLERYCLLGLVRCVFRLTKTQLRANLLGKHPNQKLFTFYKLGYYADLMP